jgi:membrane fusion protein, multidrug efflux system
MKRVILSVVVLLALLGAGLYWWKGRPAEAKTAGEKASEKKPAEEKPAEEPSRVSHDEKGNIVVKMDDETQGKLGLLVAKPNGLSQTPELKGYGRVLDPVPLAVLMTELATAQASSLASSNELARLRTLVAQQNASERAVQTAEAAALRDQLAVQSAKDRLALTWGKGIAEQTNLASFVQPLTTQQAVLVRIDLPVGETLATPPTGARICSLSGKCAEGTFLGTASTVDPTTLGRGAIFMMNPNVLGLMAGEAVTGYLQLPGEPVTGVLIPDQAVVRTEGRGWVYVMGAGADAFTRTEVALDRPVSGGWFVTHGVSTNDYVVTTGAQTLLSEELKPALKEE